MPNSFSLSTTTHYVVTLDRGCYFCTLSHQCLVEPALEVAKPAHSRMPFFVFMAFAFSFRTPDLIPACRLVPLSSGATKSSSSKTSKAINGVPGSTNAVELLRSKLPGATQKS